MRSGLGSILKPWQPVEYLEIARQTARLDPSIYDDEEQVEIERLIELRKSATELRLVGRARDWLPEDE